MLLCLSLSCGKALVGSMNVHTRTLHVNSRLFFTYNVDNIRCASQFETSFFFPIAFFVFCFVFFPFLFSFSFFFFLAFSALRLGEAVVNFSLYSSSFAWRGPRDDELRKLRLRVSDRSQRSYGMCLMRAPACLRMKRE